MTGSTFFRPDTGWVGDVIPFEKDGLLWLFYLHDARIEPKPGMPWRLVSTTDLVTFTDHGEVLPSGGPDAEDFNVYTGGVVESGGSLHLFSTAQNPWRLGPDGRPLQLVAHATSEGNPTRWTKRPELTFGAPAGYETGDWRDPYVFWDGHLWRMLVAARHVDGPDRRRGVTAQLVSADLMSWEPVDPFWDPHRYVTHECPDVFSWGEWWYLVYSEFSDAFATRYRMARSPDGPWLAPERDALDTRAFYAAKTVARDGRRFAIGWIATREGARDEGAWEWAGTMSVLEAVQHPDGTLGFRLPEEVLDAYDEVLDPGLPTRSLDAPHGYAASIGASSLPDAYLVTAELDIADGASEIGLLVRSSADGDAAGVVRLEPHRGRMVFDRWPRTRTGGEQWQFSGDVPFEHERPCTLEIGRHLLRVVVDGDILVCVLDDDVVLSTRLYARGGDHLGLFVSDGAVRVESLDVRGRSLA